MTMDDKRLPGCTDGGCIYGHPGGMHTNGGCQCERELRRVEGGLKAVREIRMLRARAEKAERELATASEMIASMQAQRNQAAREREQQWQARVEAERELEACTKRRRELDNESFEHAERAAEAERERDEARAELDDAQATLECGHPASCERRVSGEDEYCQPIDADWCAWCANITERDQYKTERNEARAAIRNAPHAVTCRVSEDARGGYDTDGSRCNCWKRAAVAGEG